MTASITGQNNPYIIGVPIDEPECFFGREDLFQFIEDNLKQNAKVILLHGQRRIGKSSVLSQIHNFVQLEQFFFVFLSLEGKSRKPLNDVLHEMTVEIKDYLEDELELQVDKVIPPSKKELQKDQRLFAEVFLNQVFELLGGKNLVLLLDEFDVLGDYSKDTAIAHFFPYLKSLIDEQEKLFIIPVVGRRLDDMPNLLGLFRQAPNQRIGLLQKRSAKRLITEPAKGVLEYQPDAIQAILELSAGHPYFTQVICFALFFKARDEGRAQVTREDVESVVDKAIEIGEAGLAWFYDGLPIPERVVFSAVAEAQQIVARKAELAEGEPFKLLQEYGVIQTDALKQAGEQLVEWGFLDLTEEPELPKARSPTYTVKIELVRRWLVRQHPLRREIWELEKLDLEAHRIYEEALKLQQQAYRLSDELKLYEQILEINPNHFSAVFRSAYNYLKLEVYNRAIDYYARAYQIDPVRAKDGLVQALLGYNPPERQPRIELEKKRFIKVLEREPNDEEVHHLLAWLKSLIEQPVKKFQGNLVGDITVGGDFTLSPQQIETYIETQIVEISAEKVTQQQLIKASPYKGLKKFNFYDREYFFGRDALIAKLFNAVNRSSFSLVLGAPGSGKSSVIRAGLIPHTTWKVSNSEEI